MTVHNEEDLLRVDGSPQGVGKKRKLKGWAIGLIALGAVLVIGLTMLGVLLFTRPNTALGAAAGRTISKLKKTEAAETVSRILDNSSIRISADLERLFQELPVSGDLKDLDAKTEFTLFRSEDGLAVSAAASLKDKELLDGRAIFSKGALTLSSTALLGKTSYGVNFKNLSKNLPDSPFDPESGSDYALPQWIADFLLKLDTDKTGELGKTARKMLTELIKTLDKSIEKHAESAREKETVEIGSSSLSTVRVDLDLDGEAIAAVCVDLLKWAKSSPELKELITKLAAMAEPYIQRRGMDADMLREEFYDKIQELLDDKEQLEVFFKNYRLGFSGNIRRLSGDLVKLTVTLKYRGSSETRLIGALTLTVGPNPKKPEVFSAEFRSDVPVRTTASFAYTVEKNDRQAYEAAMKFKSSALFGTASATGRISWDKKAEELTVKAGIPDDRTLTFKAAYANSGKLIRFSPSRLTMKEGGSEETIRFDGLELEIDLKAKFPSQPTYTDLLTLSEGDLDELGADLDEAFREIRDILDRELK